MDSLLQSVVSQFDGKFAPDSIIQTVPPATTLTIGVNVRDPWIPYLYRIGGYATAPDLVASLLNNKAVTEYSWTDWPDTMTYFEVVPLIPAHRLDQQGVYNSVTANFFMTFDNAGQNNIDVMASFEMFLIDYERADDFDQTIKTLYMRNELISRAAASKLSVGDYISKDSEVKIPVFG